MIEKKLECGPIAVVSYGPPNDSATWSGTPKAVCNEIELKGIKLIKIDGSPQSRYAKVQHLGRTLLKYSHNYFRDSPEFASLCAKTVYNQLLHDHNGIRILHLGTRTIGDALAPFDYCSFAFLDFPFSMQARLREPRKDDERNAAAEAIRLKRVKAIFVTGQYVKSELVRNYGIEPDKIRIVGTGYSGFLAKITADRPKNYTQQRILFVSKIASGWDYKGGKNLLTAFTEVRKTMPTATLVFVGSEEIARRVKGYSGVEAYGYVSEEKLADLYANASLFCMPALAEPWGLVYLEALSTGTPVIARARMGAEEIVTSTGGGWLINSSDTMELAKLIIEALSDVKELEARGTIGKIAVSQNFKWSNLIDAICENETLSTRHRL